MAMERELYQILEEKLAQLDALPEPEPVHYAKDDPRWGHFGLLLSGIISRLNDHELDGMDVEAHTRPGAEDCLPGAPLLGYQRAE